MKGNAKNGVAETLDATGGLASVGNALSLLGQIDAVNPSFDAAYGGNVNDIPVTIFAGDNWQTCRVNFTSPATITPTVIFSKWESSVYSENPGTGITLTGSCRVIVASGASDYNTDKTDVIFKTYAGYTIVDNTGINPTIDFTLSNNQVASNAAVGDILLDGPAGVSTVYVLEVTDSGGITSIASAQAGTITWLGETLPTEAGKLLELACKTKDGINWVLQGSLAV